MTKKHSYNYGSLYGLAYNEILSNKVSGALARNIPDNAYQAMKEKTGLYQDAKGSIVTLSASMRPTQARQSVQGIQSNKEVTNQELDPVEIRSLGYDKVSRRGG